MSCTVATIDYNALTWTATALGSDFLRYEIQRTEDGGATWVDVARITTESIAAWDDYESLRGVATQYRLRVVRTDLAVSAWATSGGVTPFAVDCEVALTTNWSSSLNVAYERPPEWTLEWPDESVVLAVTGRDRYVALMPTEDRGVIFTLPLIINMVDDPGDEGLQVFDAIRALVTDTTIPYVTVMDQHGNRWYAHVVTPGASFVEPGRRYVAEMRVVETRVTPTVVEVA